MANTVRVADAIAFFTIRQTHYRALAEASAAKWQNARIKYEQGLWFRLFKTPFERTNKGAVYSGFSFGEQWSFPRQERWVKEANQILAELAYHNKLKDERMEWRNDWEEDGWLISDFYAWCYKEGRPI